MALINCPDCGSDVSDQAAACPKCARPINKQATIETPRTNRSVAGGVAIVSIAMLLAAFVFRHVVPLIGAAWIVVVIIMFRWYYRDE
jgi:uncharacterized membrane protein YvbJ